MLTITNDLKSLVQGRTLCLTTLWKLVRKDATEFYFTDHDKAISFDGHPYLPTPSVNASARQSKDSFRGHDADIAGAISNDAITDEDLRAGRYRNAEIYEYLIDWRYPWIGAIRTNRWLITNVRYTGEAWDTTIVGMTHFLEQRVGDVYNRTCRNRFCDERCKLVASTYQETNCEISVVTDRFNFTATHANFTGTAADYYAFGVITWTSGNNSGMTSEVKSNLAASGTAIDFTLRIKSPVTMVVGDKFTVLAGCDRLFATCQDFSNTDNFGGCNTIPGVDKTLQSP